MNRRVTSIYVCLLCTCSEQWEQHQYMLVHCVHAMKNKGNINVYMCTVYMLSTIRVSTVSIYPPLCTSVLSRTNCNKCITVFFFFFFFLNGCDRSEFPLLSRKPTIEIIFHSLAGIPFFFFLFSSGRRISHDDRTTLLVIFTKTH